MNIAFLTEIPFEGRWDIDFNNSRTEICWILVLNAYHINIWDYEKVKSYDHVFCILPKGKVFLSADGSKISNGINPFSKLLSSNFTEILKNNNKNVHFIQEGGVDRHINDYSLEDQINYYNHFQNFNIIFAHNEYDKLYYQGLLPGKRIEVIPSLMLEHLIKNIKWKPQNKIMIGGNPAHFYRGMQSYLLSDGIKNHVKWTMTSHAMRDNEDQLSDIYHLPRMNWVDWMVELSTFKFGIHLMDLRAAGTFALNFGYYGAIVIGNKLMDTYKLIYPEWSVDVYDLLSVRNLMEILNEKSNDINWLLEQSEKIKYNYKIHFSKEVFLEKMNKILQ